jgi:hypothetical protein
VPYGSGFRNLFYELKIKGFESRKPSVRSEIAPGLSLANDANGRKILTDCFVAINAVAAQRRRAVIHSRAPYKKTRRG